MAREFDLWIIRADVAGSKDGLTSLGSSHIVAPDGVVVHQAALLEECLISAEIPARDYIPSKEEGG
jgi:predicted amidohydrolase